MSNRRLTRCFSWFHVERLSQRERETDSSEDGRDDNSHFNSKQTHLLFFLIHEMLFSIEVYIYIYIYVRACVRVAFLLIDESLASFNWRQC